MDRCWKWLLVFGLLTPSFASTVPNPTKRKGGDLFFRIHRGELWGFMDRSGKTIILPRFAAREESKCGYIDLTGREGKGSVYLNRDGQVVETYELFWRSHPE